MLYMSFCVSKINRKLIFKDLGGYETRNPSTFWCIQKADEKYNWNDFNEIIIHTGDYEISTPELVEKYSILIDIEGNGYSGRLKHLLWSHRPLLLVDRPHKEFFFEFLKEWEHYIPVKRDLTDLIEKTKWCLNNYDKALIIAENAFQFSKLYLTRDACYDKWNNIICSRNL